MAQGAEPHSWSLVWMSGPWGEAPFLPPRAAGTALVPLWHHIHVSHCIPTQHLAITRNTACAGAALLTASRPTLRQ